MGGARSGKSMYAQRAAESMQTEGRLVMIVTAQAHDDEMLDRITHHQAARGPAWHTVEAPLALTEAVAGLKPTDVVVIDCLTLWLTNLLMADADLDRHTQQLTEAVTRHNGRLLIVSNEVGFGIVPENALARRVRDACGRLHQALGAVADEVVLVVAGQPLRIK